MLYYQPLSKHHHPLPIPSLSSPCPSNKIKILTTYKVIHNSALSYITNLISNYHPNHPFWCTQDLLLFSPLKTSAHAQLQVFSRASSNFLPQSIWLSTILPAFRQSLKTLFLGKPILPTSKSGLLLSPSDHPLLFITFFVSPYHPSWL